ncbi:MAG: DUF4159 domain-containing protein [Deltaproteobacteria bacterium]|nr:DUF4159 domain-containing protein [Deltaproteobacteria bacterium]
MNRRRFLQGLLGTTAAAAWGLPAALPAAEAPQRIQFVFAQVRYRGGDWDPRPRAVTPLMEELMRRTSVTAALERRVVRLTDPELFSFPFLYMAGKYDFQPFSEEEVLNLRRFLSFGGFLLADNTLGQLGYGFDRRFRAEIQRVLPGREMRKVSLTHALLRSYYLLRRIGGRVATSSFIEGIQLGETTPVVYSHNDLAGAWERDGLGRWSHPCVPNGEEQRRDAFHLGINLILYAMTGNYKQDLIHVPFIRRRLTQ